MFHKQGNDRTITSRRAWGNVREYKYSWRSPFELLKESLLIGCCLLQRQRREQSILTTSQGEEEVSARWFDEWALFYLAVCVTVFHLIAFDYGCTCRTRNIFFHVSMSHMHCFSFHLGYHMYIILVHIDLNIVRCPLWVISTIIGRYVGTPLCSSGKYLITNFNTKWSRH